MNHKTTAWTVSIILLGVFLLFSSDKYLLAQSDSILATQTPAPTKTPALTPDAQTLVSGDGETATWNRLDRSYTQSDLSVLTGNVQRPNGLTWFNDKIYAVCSGDWTLYEIDANSGSTAQYIYGVKNAHTIYARGLDSGLELWIPDYQSNTLVNISRGVVTNIASNLNGPWGITPLDNQFLVTNLRANNVVLISSESSAEVLTNLRSPAGIAANNEYIFIANSGSARRAIEWVDSAIVAATDTPLDTSSSEISHSLVSGLQNVTSLILGSDNLLYFSYALGTRGVVGRVDPNYCVEKGGCANEDVEIVIYSELAAPLAGLTLSDDMRLYIHSIFSPDLYWVDLPHES